MATLTLQQLGIVAGGALLVASIVLSHANKLGFLPLALAVACGVGAFAKSRNPGGARRPTACAAVEGSSCKAVGAAARHAG